MKTEPSTEDFVKAIVHADRLKIVGILVQKPATLNQLAEDLSMSIRKVYKHMEFLKFVQVVCEINGTYTLDTNGFEIFSRREYERRREAFTPERGLEPERQKVLTSYLKPDGSIRQIPNSRSQRKSFMMILEYLVAAFDRGVNYSEKDVNVIIKRFHPDISGLRRDLVNAGLLARFRDGSRYWRVEKREEK